MVSARTLATVSLAGQHLLPNDSDEEPLALREWNLLSRWLGSHGHTPEDLLGDDAALILADWLDDDVSRDRLLRLLDRRHLIAKLVAQWAESGLWVIGRSDPDYPQRLRKQLRESAPPLVYGYGDLTQTEARTVAIVGSRDASVGDLELAERLARKACDHGCMVVSGGARGVDDRAAEGAFQSGGRAMIMLADSLVRNAARPRYRTHLRNGQLVLMSPYSPDTEFSGGNAMGRNRLIFCLADTAVAVSSANGKGGTFGGASQNLRHRWVPLWVPRTTDTNSGNPTLVEQGAGWLPEGDWDFEALSAWPEHATPPALAVQNALF